MFLIIKQPFLNRKYHFCNKGQFSSRNFTWFFVRKFEFRLSTREISAQMVNCEQKIPNSELLFRFWSKMSKKKFKIGFRASEFSRPISNRNFTCFFFWEKFEFRLSTWENSAKMINFEQKSWILNHFFDFGRKCLKNQNWVSSKRIFE